MLHYHFRLGAQRGPIRPFCATSVREFFVDMALHNSDTRTSPSLLTTYSRWKIYSSYFLS